MESLSNDKILTHLKEVESAAEDVLTDKQEIVDLDRKRNQTREALRAIEKTSKADYKGDASKIWMATGNTFIKMPCSAAKDMLKSGELRLLLLKEHESRHSLRMSSRALFFFFSSPLSLIAAREE